MLFFYLVLCFSLPIHEAKLQYQQPTDKRFQKCVSDIIKTYFNDHKELSIINMNTDNEEILKLVNNGKVSIVIKQTNRRLDIENQGYFIAAGSSDEFVKDFPALLEEVYWNPNARFLIMIKDLKMDRLREIFTVLLKYHVTHVLVMDESADPRTYSYNPFENNGCGHRYDSIIEYGKCSITKENLFPEILSTGLRNCTFKVAIPHWGPYSMDPNRNVISKNGGVEETILKEIGLLEDFKIEFIYTDDGEEFSIIKQDMTAVGPLYMLQNGQVDMIMGGMLLTTSRAKAFHYIWHHLAYTDEISYQVKKSTPVAYWKNIYLEFDATVWTVFICAFIVYFLIFVILVRPKDKGRIVLKMIGYLFLAGNRMKGNFFTRYLFIHWILFAYIINVYYVSNLVSFIANPLNNYQVCEEEDLAKYNMKPCVSRVMNKYLASVGIQKSVRVNQIGGCDLLLDSIKTVSKSQDLFTIVLRSIYDYNTFNYLDEYGEEMIYTFKKPIAKAVYGIYMYKGFPMLDKLQMRALRLRENGLIDTYLNHLYWESRLYNNFKMKHQPNMVNVNVPWHLLFFGYLLSGSVFCMEIVCKKKSTNRCRVLL